LALVLGTVLIASASWRVSRSLALPSFGHRIQSICLISLAQILAVMFMAGFVFDALSAGPILILQAALAVVLMLCTVPRLGWPRWPRWSPRRPLLFVSDFRPYWFSIAAGALTAIAVLVRGMAVAVLPPYAYDALWYHLSASASWLQAGRIGPTHLVVQPDVFPINGELLSAWPMALLHSMAYSAGAQFVALFLGAAASATIAHQFGVPRRFAWIGAAVFMTTPVVVAQANVQLVDLLMGALFMSGLSFGLAVHREYGPVGASCMLAGLAAGILAGMKLNGLIYAPLIAGVVVSGLVLRWPRNRTVGPRPLLLPALAFFAALVLLGGPSIARTWATTGDPVYPVAIKVGGISLASGNPPLAYAIGYGWRPASLTHASTPTLIAKSWAHDADPLLGHARATLYDQKLGGFGPQWIYFELPAILLLAVASIRHRQYRPLLLLAVVGIAFLTTPNAWWTRFTIWLPVIGGASVAWMIWRSHHLNKIITTLLEIGLVGCMGYSVASSVNIDGLELAGGGWVTVPHLVKITVGDGSGSTATLLPNFGWMDELNGPTVIALQSDTWSYAQVKTPRDASLAVTHTFEYLPTPLFGDHLQNRVVAIRPTSLRSVVTNVRASKATILVTIGGSPLDVAVANDHVDFEAWTKSSAPDFSVYRVKGRAS